MKKRQKNRLTATFLSRSENEALSRVLVAGFLMDLRVSVETLSDVKTAVSEAVTNAIVHGYRQEEGQVRLDLLLFEDGCLRVTVTDRGCGISDVARAREPFFTTDAEHERTGMGFPIMESFMDRVRIHSRVGHGTRVRMEKQLLP